MQSRPFPQRIHDCDKKLWHKFSPLEIVNIAQKLDWSTSGDSQEMWDSIHNSLKNIRSGPQEKDQRPFRKFLTQILKSSRYKSVKKIDQNVEPI